MAYERDLGLVRIPPPITTTTIPSPLPNKKPVTKIGICQCVFTRAYSKKMPLHCRLNLSLCYCLVSKQTLSVSFRFQCNSNGLADGGGVRGVMSLVILRETLREVKRQAPPNPDDEINIQVADIFDLSLCNPVSPSGWRSSVAVPGADHVSAEPEV
jgi:hypothetical protein